MQDNDNNKQKEYYLARLSNLPLDTLLQFNSLSVAPIDTIRTLAGLVEYAISWGLAEAVRTGSANQFIVSGGHGTSTYEAMINNQHTKVRTTTIDWYGDGTIIVTNSNAGLNIDFNSVEGLFYFIWDACISDARNSTSDEGFENLPILRMMPYENSPARTKFEKLCWQCAEQKIKGNLYCSQTCGTNFWKWCQDQALNGAAVKIDAFQRKMNKIRRKIPLT